MQFFDGHNDVLSRLAASGDPDAVQGFCVGDGVGHLDLPRMQQAEMFGGLFGLFVSGRPAVRQATGDGWRYVQPPAICHDHAWRRTGVMLDLAQRLVHGSGGRLVIADSVDAIANARAQGRIAMVLHLEGAQAVAGDLSNLDALLSAGVRSIGICWSRPNAFGYGIAYRYPHSSDTGPGLTAAGRELVGHCNANGVLLDLAHLNLRGFEEVARLSSAPLVVSHGAAGALCNSSRNLSDNQLHAIADSGGVLGVCLERGELRADGRSDRDAVIEDVVRQFDYLIERMGIDHVALGSDFDGARIPTVIDDICGIPKLWQALASRGYLPDQLEKLAWGNWLRVLGDTLR